MKKNKEKRTKKNIPVKLKDLKNPKIKEIKKKLEMGIRRKNIKKWNKTVKNIPGFCFI